MNPLKEFFYADGHNLVHKWIHYLDLYHKHFQDFRTRSLINGEVLTILEIGVHHGGSLEMWRDYFGEKAIIIGVDVIDAVKAMEKEGFQIEIGDQGDPKFLEELVEKYHGFDIIIDDGGHVMYQQINSLEYLWPHVKPGGIYLCEDTHTSYWSEYGCGPHREFSFIEHIKKWIDTLHSCHHQIKKEDDNKPDRSLLGMHFYDSMVFFDKAPVIPIPDPHSEQHGRKLWGPDQ